jgi:phenylpyruvate tautomerase PptA (4-oxalocrotonate tautomerase family)
VIRITRYLGKDRVRQHLDEGAFWKNVTICSPAIRTCEELEMPLWKIHHPVGAYTPADKKEFAEAITRVYEAVPIPRFYVVVIFEEVAADSFYVSGEPHDRFVRLQIDQMARTLPGPVIREWWVRNLDQVIAPWVRDRGYDWEFTITEPPADLWSLQGEIPPPFESVAEKRWIQENKATPYSQAEKLPVNLTLAPGTRGE